MGSSSIRKERLMSYIKAKTYIELAPAPTSMIFVSSFTVTANEDGSANKVVLNIALDPDKSNGQIEMPVFIPIHDNYIDDNVRTMQDSFLMGAPFVAAWLDNFDIYMNVESKQYIGFASNFQVEKNPSKYMEEESML